MMRAYRTPALAVALALFAGSALAQTPDAPVEAAPAEAAPAEAVDAPADPEPPSESAPEAPSTPPAVVETPGLPSWPLEPEAAPDPPEAAAGGNWEAEPYGTSADSNPARFGSGDDDVHLTLRWGMRIYPDAAFDALGDDRNHLAVEIGMDVRIWQQLAVGLSFAGGGEQSELYDRRTLWQDNAIFLSAVYRHRFRSLGLSVYGRLGPTVHWYDMALGDDLAPEETFEDDPWQFGARAAAGLEFWPISPGFIPYMGAFGVGVVLEGYYDQSFQTEWSSGGVDPGPFDPSGPGWSLGLTTRF